MNGLWLALTIARTLMTNSNQVAPRRSESSSSSGRRTLAVSQRTMSEHGRTASAAPTRKVTRKRCVIGTFSNPSVSSGLGPMMNILESIASP